VSEQVHPYTLIDRDRLRVFSKLSESRTIFKKRRQFFNSAREPWVAIRLGDLAVGFTPDGPGWIFNPDACNQKHAEWYRLQRKRPKTIAGIRSRIVQVIGGFRLGPYAERLLWLIHAAVLAQRSSVVTVSDLQIAKVVWGNHRPKGWRQSIRRTVSTLLWLHVGQWPADGSQPGFGADTVLLTHARDLRGTTDDRCPEHCAGQGATHHHYEFEVGPGFLGVLVRVWHTAIAFERGCEPGSMVGNGNGGGRSALDSHAGGLRVRVKITCLILSTML